MKFKLLLIVFSILLAGCGFKPLYSSKDSSFEIVEIVNKNKNKNSFLIEQMVMAISNDKAEKKLQLEIDYQQVTNTILKDSKGDPSKNKLLIKVNLNVKNQEDKILVNKIFTEEFDYNVQANKFDMDQYVENISENLNRKISNDIIFLIATLK
tara:strand:+ start:4144 stop:4602 length:459 start_codon:yes stop_codon:yes gene_type:complete